MDLVLSLCNSSSYVSLCVFSCSVEKKIAKDKGWWLTLNPKTDLCLEGTLLCFYDVSSILDCRGGFSTLPAGTTSAVVDISAPLGVSRNISQKDRGLTVFWRYRIVITRGIPRSPFVREFEGGIGGEAVVFQPFVNLSTISFLLEKFKDLPTSTTVFG
nr:hypothetical protein Iba_chr15aCG15410 [Ipomoea batatas]